MYACCMHRKPILFGPGALKGAEVLIAFAISPLVALFHESIFMLHASASFKWISGGGGKRVSLNMATFIAKVVALEFGVWRMGSFLHLRVIEYFIAVKILLPLASIKDLSYCSLFAVLIVLKKE